MKATSEQVALEVSETASPASEQSGDFILRELTAEELREWDDLVDRSPQGSLFCRSWWLAATCGTPRVLGLLYHGRLVAGMPIHYERHYGFSVCTMPKLTQTWGVVIEPLSGRSCRLTTRQMELLRPFARYLCRRQFFMQCFHPSLQNWLPFYWNGFTQTSRVTYVIEDPADHDQIWKGMTHQIRGEIRKAGRLGIAIQPCTAGQLWRFVLKTFARQMKTTSYSGEYLQRICAATEARNQGGCFAAIGADGCTHAAGMVVWDAKRAYYLVSGADPALRNSGAGSLLAWHIVRSISGRSQIFDFEGSMLEGVERFFRDFGGKPIQYNCILKYPAWAYPYMRFKKL